MGTPDYISEVSIVNSALNRIGSTQQITSFNDNSIEAAQGALIYPNERNKLLSTFPWPFAEAYYDLTEVAGPETTSARANAQWLRSYRYPPDCLKMRRVVIKPQPVGSSLPQTTGTSGINYWYNEPWRRAVGDAYPVSYGLGSDATGKLIMSDFYSTYGLTAIYTQAVSDPSQFETDFADALTWEVASELAMGLAYSDAKRDHADKMAEKSLRMAIVTAQNSMSSDIPWLRRQSEVIRARWGG